MPATPGTSTQVTVNPGVGTAASVTYDPFVGIEVGRTLSNTAATNQMGTITVSGSTTPVHGTASTYTATTVGSLSNAKYEWATTDAAAVITPLSGGRASIKFSVAGNYNVTVKITDNNKSDSPKTSANYAVVAS